MPPFKPKVVLSLLTEQEEFQRMQAEAARAAAARESVDLEILFADNNPVQQIQQIYRAVQRPPETRPAVMVVQSVSVTGVEGASRAAAQAGIGWMLLSERVPYLEALRREFPQRLVGCVYVDNEEVGRMQGRIARALLPAGGTLVSVEGPPISGAAQGRRKGLERELAGSPVKVLRWIPADWTAASADRAASAWLRAAPESARPSLISAQNDDMAEGVIAALKRVRPQWADIPVTGCDGLPERGLRLVRDKVIAATIVIPPRAGIAIETAAKHLRKQPVAFASVVTPQIHPSTRELSVHATRRVEREPGGASAAELAGS